MTTITLKKLSIVNFKGIKSLTVDFDEIETNIFGANGSGKSSIMDAFTWLLFGKDSQDRKDFDIKNTVSTELNRQDHEVSAILMINGKEESVKRVFREKWVKKQGSEVREMTGHESLFFWNDVPFQAGEFKTKIESILKENAFKLLTNALYFNSMKWDARRNILFEMAGNITDEEIANGNVKYTTLLAELDNKTLDQYKKQISAKKKTIKTSLDEITPRIAENLRSIPDAVDFDAIELEIAEANKEIEVIEAAILSRTNAHQLLFDKIQQKQTTLHKLKTDQNTLRFSINQAIINKVNSNTSSISTLKSKVDNIADSIKSKKALISGKNEVKLRIDLEIEELRTGWAKDKAREFKFDDSKFSCPTCVRDFEVDDIEAAKKTMQDNFDLETTRLLGIVNEKGTNLKKQIADNDILIKSLETALEGLEIELVEAQTAYDIANKPQEDILVLQEAGLKASTEYQTILSSIKTLEAEIGATEDPKIDVSDLVEPKAVIRAQLDSLKTQLDVRDQIKKINTRIDQLKEEEKTMSQELAALEGIEFTIDEFDKLKVDTIEERINNKFKYVSFKMFNTLINGGTEPTCVTIYNGVGFETLNTAGRIWAGLDIINALGKHYGFMAPIFLDNRESVSSLPPTNSQVINLIVSPTDETLRIV